MYFSTELGDGLGLCCDRLSEDAMDLC